MLLDFIEEVFRVEYDERPNYDKLRFMLIQKIMIQDNFPKYDQIYDWNYNGK